MLYFLTLRDDISCEFISNTEPIGAFLIFDAIAASTVNPYLER
ncbi:hypothetical protein BIFANG_03171 [Bifidobacterium angulatum DSM 20098 = JCM 7096]|uniref:Uncharacterized protein n=1 Tax=Bifidobacterium angulatum DSM 20098 = JCM 7096 TaxID=518635 RepID=C4FFQ7_9BIFI|nr:hypothetical protein BIFANG_03171 [Bifidobacterium angulatum DSM 20098 = JCM 7096]